MRSVRHWLAVLLAGPLLAAAQTAVEVKLTPVAGTVSMLEGAGGNIAVSSGPDGLIMVDDQYAVMHDKLRAALARFGKQQLRFIINTHWHADHTGGNEGFGKSGAVIVAQDNVRKRMGSDQFITALQREVKASPAIALPVVTFEEAVSFHLNGEEIRVTHVEHAHTDGDAIVEFRKARVIHTGDLFLNGFYPFVDVSSGGSIDGIISAVGRLANLIDADTRIIPGHGPLGDREALIRYRDMLQTVRGRIKASIQRGETLEQLLAAKPTADLDASWGQGFMKPEQFVSLVRASLIDPPDER